MSIGPNETFPFDPESNTHPGDIVLTMLNSILEDPREVTDDDETEAFRLLEQALETEDMEESVEFMLKALDHDPSISPVLMIHIKSRSLNCSRRLLVKKSVNHFFKKTKGISGD